MAIKVGDEGRCKKQDNVGGKCDAETCPEYGGKVEVVRIFFLDEGRIEPALDKDGSDIDEYCNKRDKPEVFGNKNSGEGDGDTELNQLRSGTLEELPEKGRYDFTLVGHSFYHCSKDRYSSRYFWAVALILKFSNANCRAASVSMVISLR